MTEIPLTDGGGDGDRPAQSLEYAYDREEAELPSEAVVRAVAALANESPLDLQPLYDVVDPDDLNDVFEGIAGSTASAEVSFTFDGFDVTVTDDRIYVREPDDAE